MEHRRTDGRDPKIIASANGEVAAAWGVSRQAAAKRWSHLLQGDRVAVVISRRARVHQDEADLRGSYGEAGGDQQ